MSERKIVDYQIVCGDYKELSYKVEEYLKLDYMPLGHPFGENGYIFQAMVKYSENE